MVRKVNIKTAQDSELIIDYIKTYSSLCLNQNIGGGTKMYARHIDDLNVEMLRRGIFTEEQLKSIE